MGEQQEPYAGSSVPTAMHTKAQHPSSLRVIYQSDSEQASSQSLQPSQQSSPAISGDSVNSKNKSRRGNFPRPVTDILRAWFDEHLYHPYPSNEDKQMFLTRTGLTVSQVSTRALFVVKFADGFQISNWFINARRRKLPALHNQMRNGARDLDLQLLSPFSDMVQTPSGSLKRLSSGNKH
jgi:hypothetical protein